MLKIEKATKQVGQRQCYHCKCNIPQDDYCIYVLHVNEQIKSYCVKCMYIFTKKLLQHFDEQKLRESIVEDVI